MKNLFMSIALLTFMGSMAAKVYASTTEVKMEIRNDDKKKKKKKKVVVRLNRANAVLQLERKKPVALTNIN